jgi:hypothetical protein
MFFCFHQVFGEGLQSGDASKLEARLWDFKTKGEGGQSRCEETKK